MSIRFGLLEILDDREDIYSERTTIASSSVEILEVDNSDEVFLHFACSFMDQTRDRNETILEQCDWWGKQSSDCVFWEGLLEDYGGNDIPYSPPLIVEGRSLFCRHPNFGNVIIFLHYSQRSAEGNLEGDIQQRAEEFFESLIFNQPEE